MCTRIEERRIEELCALGGGSGRQGAIIIGARVSSDRARVDTHSGGGIEHQREREGDVAVRLAVALAETLWCRTCRAVVGKGEQLRAHREHGHVVELESASGARGDGL